MYSVRRQARVEPPPIDWVFWRLQRFVKDWQAAALSMGLNPDGMHHHPQAWMTGTNKAHFEARSFSNPSQEQEFDKRHRLAESLGKTIWRQGSILVNVG